MGARACCTTTYTNACSVIGFCWRFYISVRDWEDERRNERTRQWLPKRRTLVLLNIAYLSINEITGDASKTLNQSIIVRFELVVFQKQNFPSSVENHFAIFRLECFISASKICIRTGHIYCSLRFVVLLCAK